MQVMLKKMASTVWKPKKVAFTISYSLVFSRVLLNHLIRMRLVLILPCDWRFLPKLGPLRLNWCAGLFSVYRKVRLMSRAFAQNESFSDYFLR